MYTGEGISEKVKFTRRVEIGTLHKEERAGAKAKA